MTTRRLGLAAAFMLGGVFLARSLAGPPTICFPYHTGGARSLPWGDDAFKEKNGYNKADLVKDTMSLLKTEESVLARMETLRRAAIYAQGDTRLSTELLAKLGFIALDTEAAGKPSARPWFNAGFLAACYAQLGTDIDWNPGQAEGSNGYAWIRKALELEPENAEMHFAAALATHGRGSVYNEHLRRALAGAAPGSNLEQSMNANAAIGPTLAELRKGLGSADASNRGH